MVRVESNQPYYRNRLTGIVIQGEWYRSKGRIEGMSQRGCASCPFLGMAFDRQLHASYPHHQHVCWAVAEPRSVGTTVKRWIGWRPWQSGEAAKIPWQARLFSPVHSNDQARCLGSAYAACPQFPASTSMLRRM